jgi:hypothetical protein
MLRQYSIIPKMRNTYSSFSITAQGNAIHCQIPSFLAATRGDEFQVGKIYKMTRFSVARAKSTYKPVDGDLMLYVTPYTTLELCHTSPSGFPLYVYHLTSYDKIDPDGSNARNFHGMFPKYDMKSHSHNYPISRLI